MIRRRTTTGLSLLCALAFCAFAAQSASAAKAVNTTAFTCVKDGGNLDFSDAHCDSKVTQGTGSYGHVAIQPGTTLDVIGDNTTTAGATSPAVLKGKAFGTAVEISCATVTGEGTLHNIHDSTGSQHTVTGTATSKISKCTVLKPAKCVIAEPIEVAAELEGVEGIGAEKNTMGIEAKPDGGGKVFLSITFKNKGAEKCGLNEKTLSVEGTAIGTGSVDPKFAHTGATAVSTDAMTTETLIFGGEKAAIDSIGTIKSKDGTPVALTTVT